MRAGFVGLGKLGLPVAVAMAGRGAAVMGYDRDPDRMSRKPQPYREAGPDGTGDFNDHLAATSVRFGELDEVVAHAEILFVAVQTPHDPRFEGITPLPSDRADFDYTWLRRAVRQINETCLTLDRRPIVAIISTVLPGTLRREILPLLETSGCPLVYNPSFIAMGTTMWDFLHPEFVLLGGDDQEAVFTVSRFYTELYGRWQQVKSSTYTITNVPPAVHISLESAELVKVAYNTFIGQKIVFANTIMEICDHLGEADCDEVVNALSLADRRLISPAYLRGGMGDGGGCHPRDNIAMSWLAGQLSLSHDLFQDIMKAREDHARRLVGLLRWASSTARVLILGYAYKPDTNLTVGSPALLVRDLCDGFDEVTVLDHHVQGYSMDKLQRLVLDCSADAVLIGCRHKEYAQLRFNRGTVVIDPFRYVRDGVGYKVWRLGEAARGA